MSAAFRQSARGKIQLAIVGELALNGYTEGWQEQDWREYTDFVIEEIDRLGTPKVGIIIHGAGHIPSATQRAWHTERVGPERMKMQRLGIMTESILARGAITAVSWIAPVRYQLKAFKPGEIDPMLKWAAEVAKFDWQEARTQATAILHLVFASSRAAAARGAAQ